MSIVAQTAPWIGGGEGGGGGGGGGEQQDEQSEGQEEEEEADDNAVAAVPLVGVADSVTLNIHRSLRNPPSSTST